MDPLNPYSFNHAYTTINGLRYHYVDQVPVKESGKLPIVLVHGFPDLWYGWRHQIRPLVEAGHRVILPSTTGYCDTDAPLPYEYYTFKRIATDIIDLVSNLAISKAIYIGHDWGSVIVQRIALWFPKNVAAVAAICVPFIRPAPGFVSLEQVTEMLPSLKYQLWLSSPDAERKLSNPELIETFLKILFRAKNDAPVVWNTGKDFVSNVKAPSLGSVWEKLEVFEYYLQCFQRKGSLSGPLTYYKTRGLNYEEELELVDSGCIQCPALFIGALDDPAIPPSIWGSQGWVPQLEKHTVSKSHWCLVEDQGKEIKPIIQSWVKKVSELQSKM